MLVIPSTANCAGGMVLGFSPRAYRPRLAVAAYRSDVTNTKLSSWRVFPPEVAYSRRRP